MRRTRIMVAASVAAGLALAGLAGAAVLKGSGKSSISIIGILAPGHGNNAVDVKPMGTVSSKPLAGKVGGVPTGGALFSAKLAKDLGDPTKPGFADGQYVLEVESAPTPDSAIVGNLLAAAFFVRFDITGGKCTVHTNPKFLPGGTNCAPAVGHPNLCATDAVGKCSATIYQVAGEALANPAGQLPGDPFGARFRIRKAPAADCNTGDTCINGAPPGGICTPAVPPNPTTCFTNPVIAVGGVALAPFGDF